MSNVAVPALPWTHASMRRGALPVSGQRSPITQMLSCARCSSSQRCCPIDDADDGEIKAGWIAGELKPPEPFVGCRTEKLTTFELVFRSLGRSESWHGFTFMSERETI